MQPSLIRITRNAGTLLEIRDMLVDAVINGDAERAAYFARALYRAGVSFWEAVEPFVDCIDRAGCDDGPRSVAADETPSSDESLWAV